MGNARATGRLRALLLTVPALAVGLFAVPTRAVSDSCREWRAEHRDWKGRALRGFLGGAPQAEIDRALFELLQREAYLTSCDVSVEGARGELVGWRLVGRDPDEYAVALVESLLAQGGLDLDLRPRLAAAEAALHAPPVAAAPPPAARRGPHAKRPGAAP